MAAKFVNNERMKRYPRHVTVRVVLLLYESQIHIGNVVLFDVLDFPQIKLRVVLFKVLEADSQANQLSQEGAREACLDQLPVRGPQRRLVQALADQLAGKLVVFQLERRRDARVGVNQGLTVVAETRKQAAAPPIEDGHAQKFDPFSAQSTPIESCATKRSIKIRLKLPTIEMNHHCHPRGEFRLITLFSDEGDLEVSTPIAAVELFRGFDRLLK